MASPILSRLREVHDARTLKRVYVPEYDLELYFRPLTVADSQRALKGIDTSNELDVMINGILHTARDKDGKPLVDMMNPEERVHAFSEMRRMEYRTLIRIAAEAGAQGDAPALAELPEVEWEDMRKAIIGAIPTEADNLKTVIDSARPASLMRAFEQVINDAAAAESVKNV